MMMVSQERPLPKDISRVTDEALSTSVGLRLLQDVGRMAGFANSEGPL